MRSRHLWGVFERNDNMENITISNIAWLMILIALIFCFTAILVGRRVCKNRLIYVALCKRLVSRYNNQELKGITTPEALATVRQELFEALIISMSDPARTVFPFIGRQEMDNFFAIEADLESPIEDFIRKYS